MNKNNKLGIILILVGLFILVNNFNLVGDEAILYFVSLGFFIGYFLKKGPNIGLLIPACIVLSVGLFSTLEPYFYRIQLDGTGFFLFLGTAFLAIYIIHNIRLKTLNEPLLKWPGIVAICIYVFSIFILIEEKLRFSFTPTMHKFFWPTLLVLVGLFMIFNTKNKDEE